jgi:hydrogenase/urease accessory protein HupE
VRWALLSALILILGSCITTTHAHEMRPAYLEIKETEPGTYDVLWKVPAKGRMRLGLYVRFSEDTENLSEPIASIQGGAYIERYKIYREGGLADTEIYIDGLRSTLTDVLVRFQGLDGSTQVQRLSPERPSFTVKAKPSSGEVAKTYTVLGIQHIWKGIDHLLFVACLMMVAGTRRRLLITITGFTIAHSITLVLSTLDVVRLPVAPVEAVIALSILFLAVEIAKGRKDSLTYRYPIAVSASFGLLHGFGFAAVLTQIGLPQQDVPVSLLFFNVGVEVGQILFVVGVIAIVSFARKVHALAPILQHSTTARLQRCAAYIIGSFASFWMIERIRAFWG